MVEPATLGLTWHLVVDHIMLVMKMRSSSPANRPVKRIYVHVQKKEKKKWLFTAGAVSSDWRKPVVNCYCPKKKMCLSVDLLNDYICTFFTGLYCESLI